MKRYAGSGKTAQSGTGPTDCRFTVRPQSCLSTPAGDEQGSTHHSRTGSKKFYSVLFARFTGVFFAAFFAVFFAGFFTVFSADAFVADFFLAASVFLVGAAVKSTKSTLCADFRNLSIS